MTRVDQRASRGGRPGADPAGGGHERADRAAGRLAARIAVASRALGRPVVLDGPGVLRQRHRLDTVGAAGGTTSPGGGCHLLPCADGWVAISLARPSDLDLLPAWLALADAPPPDVAPTTPDALRPLVARCPGRALADAAGIVGLPVGLVGEIEMGDGDAAGDHGVRVLDLGRRAVEGPLRVLDLSALWAGPLCAQVLGRAGAEVTRVESLARPDTSRAGSPALYAHLNGDKAERSIDLATAAGIDGLRALIRSSDVVVESSRPRALEQLGIVAIDELQRDDGPAVWVSITGHGRSSPRVAFGDDAAAAGGLLDLLGDEPRFAGDALADPLAGLAAAASALEVLADGRSALVDVALARVAAAAAQET